MLSVKSLRIPRLASHKRLTDRPDGTGLRRLSRHQVDPDLRLPIPAHWPDSRADRECLIRSRLCSPPGRAGQGRSLRSRRHGDGASAPLDSPAPPGGFRQLSDEAPLRLGQVAGRSRRHARSARRPHEPSARGRPADQLITSGPAHQAGHCQGRVDIKRPRRRVENDASTPRSSAAYCAPTAAVSGTATSRPWPSCSAWPRRSMLPHPGPSRAFGARSRLLLGRDRLPARHHPAGRSAALGSP